MRHGPQYIDQTYPTATSSEQKLLCCLFSDIVCKSDEVCFNDLVIGRCISASSDNQNVERLGPLEGPSLGLLEAEMSRVFGLGFSWPDKYTQCVFQTLISSIQHRQPYSRELCGTYITAQKLVPQDNLEQDLDDADLEGDDKLEDVFLVPDDVDDNEEEKDSQQQTFMIRPDDYDGRHEAPLMIVEDGEDDMTDLEQQEAWLQLQNVLHKMKEPQLSELVIVPDEEDLLDDDFENDDQIILVPLDDGSFVPLGETDRQIPLLQVPIPTVITILTISYQTISNLTSSMYQILKRNPMTFTIPLRNGRLNTTSLW